MKILALSAGGKRNGSADILAKSALRSAEQLGADVRLVRLNDLELSQGPSAQDDDGPWLWDQLMQSDGLIVSTPIYARTIPGKLRLLGDKIAGPQADVAFTSELLRMRASGEPVAVDFAVDERVLRQRVGGFIAVGGSLPDRWKSLALPLMHTLTESMKMPIVDQVQFAGAGSPSSIVLDQAAIDRAAQLGRAVADQSTREEGEVEYLGARGTCPLCHLSVVVIGVDGAIECASCGAGGRLEVVEGAPAVVFDLAGRRRSILDFEEKLDHFREVQQTAALHATQRAQIDAAAADWATWEREAKPPQRR